MATTMQVSGAAAMVAAGQEQISGLVQKLEKLDEMIAEAEDQIADIHAAHESRGTSIEAARVEHTRLSLLAEQAAGYAKLAYKLPHESKAVKEAAAAAKAANNAKKALDTLVTEDEASYQITDPLEADLHKSIFSWNAEKEARKSELQAMQSGMVRAFAELGNERYLGLSAAYEAAEQRVSDVRHQLLLAMMESHLVHEEALQALAEWPALQIEMRNKVPADDATLRCLEVTKLHVETLLRDASSVTFDMPGMPWRLVDTLFIHEAAIFSVSQLEEHLRRLNQVIVAYRSHLAQQQ